MTIMMHALLLAAVAASTLSCGPEAEYGSSPSTVAGQDDLATATEAETPAQPAAAIPETVPTLARVAGDKLPGTGRFPHAAFPLAQAPDGCSGYDSDAPEVIRDNWGIVDFTDSCNKHDTCYYTLGAEVGTCNQDFKADLIDACEDKADANPAFLLTLPLCKELAVAYWGVVRGAASSVFPAAQAKQQDYVAYADEVFAGIFIKLTGRDIRGGDLRRAHATLLGGSLNDVERQIVDRYGDEIVRNAYRAIAGGTLAEAEVPGMTLYLLGFGVDRLWPEMINRYATEIVQDLYFEIKGTREVPELRMLFYRNRLIQTKDPDQVRTLIEAT